MNWLNPVNWFRAAAASALDEKIDEYLTVDNARKLVADGVNKALDSAEWWNDDRSRKVAKGLKVAGTALANLGAAIDPDGECGRGLSPEEVKRIECELSSALYDVVTDDLAAGWRDKLKSWVRSKIGL